jgi:hypothetical protein
MPRSELHAGLGCVARAHLIAGVQELSIEPDLCGRCAAVRHDVHHEVVPGPQFGDLAQGGASEGAGGRSDCINPLPRSTRDPHSGELVHVMLAVPSLPANRMSEATLSRPNRNRMGL